MKRPGLTSRLVSATLFLILGTPAIAPAQEMMSGAAAAKAAKRSDELLKRFDKNGDGKLDDDERADAKEMTLKEQVDRQMARAAALPGGLEQFRAEALQMFDLNRDGQLDDEEKLAAQKFAAAQQERELAAEQLNKRFDQNGDGTIDTAERGRIDSYLSALRALGSTQMRAELLRRFDLNADGKVDDGEWNELEKFVRPRMEASAVQVRRHDTNRDGKIDDVEWVVARSAITQWLNGSGTAALENDPALARAPVMNSSVETEHARLKAVAAEVARRRALREAATKPVVPGTK